MRLQDPIRVGRAALLLGATLYAAVLPSSPAAQTTIRDSAGIRIVQNPSRARARVVFQLGATPSYQVGGPEEPTDNEFTPNQGYLRGVRLSDNGFVAIDVVRVHFFDAAGKRVRITGRDGAGPEEFRYLTSICRTRGDTVVVSDSRNDRIGVLDRNGTIVRSFRQNELGSPPFEGCFDDGTVVLERALSTAPGASRKLRLTRVRLDGSVVNSIGDFTFPPFDFTQNAGTVAVGQQRLYVGDGLTSEIRVYNPAGKLTSIIRSDDPPVRITAAEADARMRATIPNNTPAAQVEERMQRMRSRPRATNWPAYQRAQVDARGRLWVQDYPMKLPSPNAWTAFDAEGRLIGRLVIPPPASGARRLEIIAFGMDQILVRRRDDDGFAYLTVLPIQTIRR
ncbi:MAG: hypothetical protein WEE89_18750 [Gemmatimonadota bacterium]